LTRNFRLIPFDRIIRIWNSNICRPFNPEKEERIVFVSMIDYRREEEIPSFEKE
jgi:hypothetical protein